MCNLQDQQILREIQQVQDTVDWKDHFPLHILDKVVRTNKAGRAPDQYGFRKREHMKIILDEQENADLYYRVVTLPMIQGTFRPGELGLSTCSQLCCERN